MTAYFTVLGEPRGKARPRVVKRGNFVNTYTPDETVLYENLIKTEYHRQCNDVFFPQGIPLVMWITACYAIPKNTSKKKRAEMLQERIFPTKKPDIDNVIKVFADALNGVAFHDDVQIVNLHLFKKYDEQPKVEVRIQDMESAYSW